MSEGKWLSEIRGGGLKQLTVVLDDREYPLYPSEIEKLGLRPEMFVEESLYLQMLELLGKRALKYSAHLLKQRDYTEKMLQDRLKLKKYPPESICYALDYLSEKHYLDDERYARNYCESKKDQYGRLRIKNELLRRGVSVSIIEVVLEEGLEQEEVGALIERYARQRGFQKEECDFKQRDRFYRYLIGKGLAYGDIAAYFE